MGQKSIKGSLALGKKIRFRRNELNLTIEEAASRAGVGTKTWSRYEAGESIRIDKSKGIFKALNWHDFPNEESDTDVKFDLNEYKKHEAWSQYLKDCYDESVAISFIIGSDILLDNLQQDINELSSMPKGSHLGEIDVSWLEDALPKQFLMQYDYDFLYILRATVIHLRMNAASGGQIIAHSVIEELALFLIMEESEFLMESLDLNDNWTNWAFDIFDDMDIVTWLYSDYYIDVSHPYHFDRWQEKQFYCEQNNQTE